ncbi:Glucose-1-phosphate adenylyltransferase [Tessaracoccus sp. O5.2]|uniref:hypothetical protein n=1 Tax=Tessaracoccus sp. O5.2 TaxID=3157622 RepID=UPI0035EA7829
MRRGAVIENSLVSPGCVIDGTVRDSVLGPGVTVAAGAVVEHAVVLADVEIREEAQVRFAVVDEGAVVGKGAEVGEDLAGVGEDLAGEVSTEGLVLVGMGAHVRGRRKLRRGDRVGPAGGGRD